jgi:hypothetical protein
MALTLTVTETNVGRLVSEDPAYVVASLNGGNPYAAGGLAVTAATLQTATNSYLSGAGLPGNVRISSIDDAYGVGSSQDGFYRAVWNGTNVEIWDFAVPAEAGAIDLSAATTDVHVRFQITREY